MARASLVLFALLISGQVLSGSAASPLVGLLGDIGGMITSALPGYRYCPPPYHHILGECFYIHQYVPQLSWQEAQDFCRQAGGIGAEPKYFGVVLAQLFNMGKANEIYNGELSLLWLGGHRVGNTTEFIWSSGSDIKEEVKEGGEARSFYTTDTEASQNADCVMMVITPRTPPALMAEDCDVRAHYVCQLK